MGKRCAGDVQWHAASTMMCDSSEHYCTRGAVSAEQAIDARENAMGAPGQLDLLSEQSTEDCSGGTPRRILCDGGKFRVGSRLIDPLQPIIRHPDRPIRKQLGVSAVQAASETVPPPILRPCDQMCPGDLKSASVLLTQARQHTPQTTKTEADSQTLLSIAFRSSYRCRIARMNVSKSRWNNSWRQSSGRGTRSFRGTLCRLRGPILTDWPVCWWVLSVIDHFSRRSMRIGVFQRRPTSEEVTAVLDRIMSAEKTRPKHLKSDCMLDISSARN